MKRRSTFDTVRITGGLLPSGLLERVGSQDSSLEAVEPTDYYLAPGERLGEAITRSWNRLSGIWEHFSKRLDEDGALTGPTRREWLLPLFQELGFGHLPQAPDLVFGEKSYPISHLWETTPFLLFGVGVDLDRRNPGIAGAATASPHGVMQEFLNRSEEHLWGVVSNGKQLRLLRDNASLTRTAYVEFDLRATFEGEAYSDFAVLWLACHASRLEGPAGKEVLERWREDAAKRGVRALDALRDGVETAIEALGSAAIGHPDNAVLRKRLDDRSLDAQELYRQLLRIVYRFLFLLVSESRGLLLDPDADPMAARRYQDHYSVTRLRDLAETVRGSRHGDLWQQHNVVALALEATGEPALGLLPLGGFLWSSESTEALDEVTIPNEAILTTIRALTTVRPPGELPQRVDYANLGAEELGSIYESLLEYVPEVNPIAGTIELKSAAGNERKTTGSYYTPTSLINELLNSALDPVLEEAARAEDPEQAILDLDVVDPAAGSGHFLIAAAHRIADRLARVRAGDDQPSPDQLRTALRDVIGHCTYAVDINPMAVELAKVALWIEAMEPGKPLTFLDHHIVCGNSLLGTTPRLLERGIPDAAFKALTGDDKAVVAQLKKRNRAEGKGSRSRITGEDFTEQKGLVALAFADTPEDLMQNAAEELAAIDDLADDSMTAIAEKQRRYADFAGSEDQRRLRLAADAWVAAFVGPKTDKAPQITTAVVNAALNDPVAFPAGLSDQITAIASEHRFHHWHLAFPHIFGPDRDNEETGWSGGFDVVLGNPPWERVKLQEREFFATSAPEIASTALKSDREALIAALEDTDPDLFRSHREAVHRAEALSQFCRTSMVYPLAGHGDINTYSVFAELMRSLKKAGTGRAGFVVPTGIATDDANKVLFREIATSGELVSLYDFINDAGLFPGVGHGRQKFCLTTLGHAGAAADPEFAFFLRLPIDLREPSRRYRLSSEDIARLNPTTFTAPAFRTQRDADITSSVYRRWGVLRTPDSNPWELTIRRIFNIGSSDVSRVLIANDLRGIPNGAVAMYEAKMTHQFDYRYGDYELKDPARMDTALPEVPDNLLSDPAYQPQPRYWLEQEILSERLSGLWDHGWMLTWRDVARSTDERTVIASIIPRAATDFTLRVGFIDSDDAASRALLLVAILNSFVLDYVARQKLGGTHVSDYVLTQLPVPTPQQLQVDCPLAPSDTWESWLRPALLELTYVATRLQPLARDLKTSVSPFGWSTHRRWLIRAELDAALFHLYGLSRDDLAYVLESFPIVKRKDIAAHGSYRTKELILDVYDRMAKAIETGEPYQTILDPPPADPALCHAPPEGGVH